MKKYILCLSALLLCAQLLRAQSVLGTWKTVDDNSGEARSHIHLFESGGKLYGKIDKLLQKPPSTVCELCPGERKGQPLTGMILLIDMTQNNGMWQSGNVLDPDKGKWYACKLWLKEGDPNTLVVRGYLGPFYRTQYWQRVP